MSIKRLTPVIVVDQIEPVMQFWVDAGFEMTMHVPHGETLGFVMLSHDKTELMFQTVASVLEDCKNLPVVPAKYQAALFIEVTNLDEVIANLSHYAVFLPRRNTFYGSDEIGYRDPSGQFVTFAQFKSDANESSGGN